MCSLEKCHVINTQYYYYIEKGDIQDDENYRNIKMTTRDMRMWELIAHKLFRDETTI